MHPAGEEQIVETKKKLDVEGRGEEEEDILDSFAIKGGGGDGGLPVPITASSSSTGSAVRAAEMTHTDSAKFSTMSSSMSAAVSRMGAFAASARPWTEFFDFREFSLRATSAMGDASSPPSILHTAVSRSHRNGQLYTTNYVFIVLLVTAVYVAFNPYSALVLLVVVSMWTYVFILRGNAHGSSLTLMGRQMSSEQVMAVLGIASVMIVFFMSNTGHVLLGAVGVGVVICLVHSVLREPPELFDGDIDSKHGSSPYGSALASVQVAGNAAALRTAFNRLWNSDIDAV